ncbi:N-alpha-acetyltransferase 38, NatC auxiliary subunit [Geranomyces variabilis]|uniref:N-alpha-acetyltransferase 38, NatC auxiliary subunit n=1 Tax=Geranomyces variabilis TaxID=109894 RepID=A0AAD5XP85_9FUNG|nr:N-alpha-acetyltransferase 38, NatC auxiliary subunit [Geranomyces variabilis]
MESTTWRAEKLTSLLNARMRITISDGRVFVGYFMCIDRGRNTILAAADEFKNEERRFVGLIMIPGNHLVKAEIEAVADGEEDPYM